MKDERQVFEALVRRNGRPGPRTVQLADKLTYDGNCWSHAWHIAQERGGRYVEGMCWLGGSRVRAHAWVELDSPFGQVLIECTEGYENAHRHLGITVDSTPGGYVDTITAKWEPDFRASVIEALVAAGIHTVELLALIAPV